ncbi:hypothetical protein I317_06109 [Kwoniella heveanensis CBS 569]|nr:hypothetical protein I317_06109 [Kwoniella heveanensis CBS 569]
MSAAQAQAQPQTDFSTGADFISFGISPSPPPESKSQAGPSRTPIHPSLPAKPTSSENRKGKRKASDADAAPEADRAESSTADKGKKSKKQKKGKRDREKDKEKSNAVNGDSETGPRNLKEERKAAERHAPWADLVDWARCRDPAEMLNEEINAFYKYVSPTREEFEVRLFMIELITRTLLKLWPDAEVTPFGSWQTQLYLPQGDIDLVVSNKQFSESNKARLLAEMARAMRVARITDTVAIISRARVPIIKFITNEGKLNVDISLNQVNGISAGKIINQYLDALPGARQLILVVKSFLSQRSMNEVYTGGLGSYAVICLVISFLQVHPKLRRSELDPEENLGTLLVEFFELYGRNFNYQDVGLSIRKGGYYYLKSSRGWLRPNQSFLLSIEDPQDRDNDISGGSFGIRQVKNTLAGAYELLLMRLFERAEEISGRSSGRKKVDYDPDKMSILTGVMGITKETLKQRTELKKLHAEGRLQRLLNIPPDSDPKDHVINYREPPSLSRKADRNQKDRTTKGVDDALLKDDRRTGVGAIIVDDDEVDVEDDEQSNTDSDFDPFESEDSRSFDGDTTRDLGLDVESGDEEGEIVEISNPQPKTHHSTKAQRDALTRSAAAVEARYGGESDVSQDSIEILSSPPTPPEEESRYALTKNKSKSKPEANTKFTNKKSKRARRHAKLQSSSSDSDSSSESESDSSVQAISPPAGTKSGSKNKYQRRNGNPNGNARRSSGEGSSGGVKGSDRRAFWAAKGSLGGIKPGSGTGPAGGGGEWDDDADFVGLE